MASVAGTAFAVSVRPPRRMLQVSNGLSDLKSVSFTNQRKSSVSIRSAPRLRVSCAAKPETLEKVCLIVRKQLAIVDETLVTGESIFSELGADSLDTVEIMMGLEEEFEVSVNEEIAYGISTVQQAADMIEILLEHKDDSTVLQAADMIDLLLEQKDDSTDMIELLLEQKDDA